MSLFQTWSMRKNSIFNAFSKLPHVSTCRRTIDTGNLMILEVTLQRQEMEGINLQKFLEDNYGQSMGFERIGDRGEGTLYRYTLYFHLHKPKD